jgi:hypothetical protein
MIDANGCGQNYQAITETAAAIYNSDPQKNIVFGFHCYGGTSLANAIPYFTAMKNAANTTGFCVAVMEFGPYRNPPQPPSTTNIPTQTLIAYCEQVGIGYAGWAIDNNNGSNSLGNDTNGFPMMYNNFATNQTYPSNMTQFGKYACLDPIYGLQANARTASSL